MQNKQAEPGDYASVTVLPFFREPGCEICFYRETLGDVWCVT